MSNKEDYSMTDEFDMETGEILIPAAKKVIDKEDSKVLEDTISDSHTKKELEQIIRDNLNKTI